jgi:hypothetical protein
VSENFPVTKLDMFRYITKTLGREQTHQVRYQVSCHRKNVSIASAFRTEGSTIVASGKNEIAGEKT